MKTNLFLKPILFLTLFSFFLPFIASAQACSPCPPNAICNPLDVCTIEDLIESIINFIFLVAVVVVPLMIIVAGLYFLSAGGDPNKVKTAKDIILYSVIGLMIVLLAKALISVVEEIIGG